MKSAICCVDNKSFSKLHRLVTTRSSLPSLEQLLLGLSILIPVILRDFHMLLKLLFPHQIFNHITQISAFVHFMIVGLVKATKLSKTNFLSVDSLGASFL